MKNINQPLWKMTVSWVAVEEGYREKPYLCPKGFWTAGYGFNFDAHGEAPRELPVEEALEILEAKLSECYDAVERLPIAPRLNNARKCALANAVYVLGEAGIKRFINTLEFIRREDWKNAGREFLRSGFFEDAPGRCMRIALVLTTGQEQDIPIHEL